MKKLVQSARRQWDWERAAYEEMVDDAARPLADAWCLIDAGESALDALIEYRDCIDVIRDGFPGVTEWQAAKDARERALVYYWREDGGEEVGE